ncbi:MAG: peptidoglycan-binding protein [Chitinophagales bacterium]|nr:peptidoglycan-binding protein [Chitinophagales bacterium]
MAYKLNDKGSAIKKWQQFLTMQRFFTGAITDFFGPKTETATKAFQKFYNIPQTGLAGSLTLGKANELGFNPDKEPSLKIIRNDTDMMRWIKENLSATMRQAVTGSFYTEDWLAGMCARETGFKIIKFFNQQHDFAFITANMLGDYSKRSADAVKRYHGYGYWQIDIASYPDFVNSNDWKDASKTVKKAVSVLNEKKKYLEDQGWDVQLTAEEFSRAITAAYNCGQGNVVKALRNNLDIDAYTYSKDYSKEVWRYRSIYRNL